MRPMLLLLVKLVLLVMISIASVKAFFSSASRFRGSTIHHRASSRLLSSEVSADPVDFLTVPTDGSLHFGDYTTINSAAKVTERRYIDVRTLGTNEGPAEGDLVWIRGRLSNVRAKGNSCFTVIRSNSFYTVQALHFKDKEQADLSKSMIKFIGNTPLESIVDICGTVASGNVKSASQSNVEIQINKFFVVSKSETVLPFLYEDACRPQSEIDASQDTERPFAGVSQEARLNNRWLDLRVPANNAILRIRSGVSHFFREALMNEGFMEINTPKLIGGESEGGAEAFKFDYFGKDGVLAQSPQLYKQMAIASDLERVFEIGPVFRAENSNTRRHLCEFTGLDFEMAITEHYDEALLVIHKLFKHIFTGLEKKYSKEIEMVRQQFPSEPLQFTEEPLILHWEDAMKMLQDAGHEVSVMDDLTGALELALGAIVKEKYQSDFFILDRYPSSIRPFYTMHCADNPDYSNSYDVFIRGQEICSGAQRCHVPELLEKQILGKGMDLEPLQSYIDSFRHGCPPHAGGGIGLDRVVFLFLGLDNIRKASMFPRDPNRLAP